MNQELHPYADIILPLAVPQYYTYRIPDEIISKAEAGCRVTVILGKRHIYTGIIRRLHNNPPKGITLSAILALLDTFPIVDELQMMFWEWLADYYMCTPGEVYRAAVPSGLKLESETRVFIRTSEDLPPLTPAEENLVDIIENAPGITLHKLATALGRKDVMHVIKSLIEKEVLSIEENLKESYKSRTRDYVLLKEVYHDNAILQETLDKLEKKAPVQAKIIYSLLRQGDYTGTSSNPVSKKMLLELAGASPASLKTLSDKGIIGIKSVEISRLADDILPKRKPYALNKNQTRAHIKILDEFKQKDVVLLHGVTSSGKTEIYMHLIEHTLRKNRQVLYLLPEIALTAQIIQRLQSVFGNMVGVYHSRFSDAERVEVYQNLKGIRLKGSPAYKIILGVRSSVFLPFRDLGLIIIDEEHENTYKQFDPAPRYSARDAAVVLAGMHKAKVLMGTATPSFESYLNALNGRYGLVELNDRYLDIQLPQMDVIDLREARKRKQMHTHFSRPLVDAITETLNNREQVILFQNRRGFAPYLECQDCGWIPFCKHCDVSLTYHKKDNRLHCHYCGYTIANPPSCDSCGNQHMQTRGFGTEKVEDEIALLFPDARIARMDLDTTRSRRSYEKIIEGFQDRQVDILIGTQIISKGLDFDHVRVVGILNADNMLNFPDFRSFERSYQLIAQVSGRAGRKGEQGKVIIQTSDPQNIVIKYVAENDYKSFLKHQLRERLNFKYPPYYRLVKLLLRHKKLPVVSKAASQLAKELRRTLGERVLGPEFPLISRLYTLHQKSILIKIERDKHFSERRKAVQDAIDKLMTHAEFKSLQIIPDVDPYN